MDRIGSKHPSHLYLREWMKHKGLNNSRIAERMDASEGTISKLLNGKMEMTTSWLANFADALDISVPDLFLDPKRPTRDELLASATPEELRQALQLVRMVRTGTDG